MKRPPLAEATQFANALAMKILESNTIDFSRFDKREAQAAWGALKWVTSGIENDSFRAIRRWVEEES